VAWEDLDTVALDRVWCLQYVTPRSWIEEGLKRQMQARPKTLIWVKGHQGIEGNGRADKRAKVEVEMGWSLWRTHKRDVATPAGIKQAYPMHPKAPPHMRWTTKAIKGLVYVGTDKGPQRQWLWEVGRAEEPWCVCDGWTPQNAAHFQCCPGW